MSCDEFYCFVKSASDLKQRSFWERSNFSVQNMWIDFDRNQASKSTQLHVTRVFFLFQWLSRNFEDKFSSNFHRFVLFILMFYVHLSFCPFVLLSVCLSVCLVVSLAVFYKLMLTKTPSTLFIYSCLLLLKEMLCFTP